MTNQLREQGRVGVLQQLTNALRQAQLGDVDGCQLSLKGIEAELGTLNTHFAASQHGMIARIRRAYALPTHELGAPPNTAATIPVDSYVKEIKSGISVVTCCMNRSENLLKALRTWIDHPEISQIVIVDWSSIVPFQDELKAAGVQDERILVARVEHQSRWILSYAFNFGFRIATYDKILKTDADITIGADFFRENELKENAFLSGDWRTAEKGQEHINGFFFARRADLMSVKGFNEYITTYGWDDDDLYFRMEQHGFNRVRIKKDTIYHIPHGDAQRLGGSANIVSALDDFRSDPSHKIMGNRFLATAMPMWGEDKILLHFDTQAQASNYILAQQVGESFNQVPPHVQADADYYGLVAVVSWHSEFGVYRIPKGHFYTLLERRQSRGDVTRFDIRLAMSSTSPVCWSQHCFVLYFDDDVDGDSRFALIEQLIILGEKYQFTVFCDEWLYRKAAHLITQTDSNFCMPIPDGFFCRDLNSCTPNALANLADTLKTSPAFWTQLSAQDAHDLSFALGLQLRGGSVERGSPKSKQAGSGAAVRPRLYIDAQHGLGNRLRALASATTIARQSGRDLFVIWTPDHHCDCTLRDLFKYEGNVVADIDALDLSGAARYSYMEAEQNSCKDGHINLNTERDIYIKSAYVINNDLSSWEKENAILRELIPVDAVMELVSQVVAEGRVGVHVRMEGAKDTDHHSYDAPQNWNAASHAQISLWRGKSHYEKFMQRMDKLIAEDHGLRFFLAADTAAAYSAFSAKYGERFSCLPRRDYDRSLGQLRFALADALLLSRCKLLMGSTWSSFSELAQRLSTTIERVEMSGADF